MPDVLLRLTKPPHDCLGSHPDPRPDGLHSVIQIRTPRADTVICRRHGQSEGLDRGRDKCAIFFPRNGTPSRQPDNDSGHRYGHRGNIAATRIQRRGCHPRAAEVANGHNCPGLQPAGPAGGDAKDTQCRGRERRPRAETDGADLRWKWSHLGTDIPARYADISGTTPGNHDPARWWRDERWVPRIRAMVARPRLRVHSGRQFWQPWRRRKLAHLQPVRCEYEIGRRGSNCPVRARTARHRC